MKAKATLCDVGAVHLPGSDGVLVSVMTVSARDALLLRKIKMYQEVSELAPAFAHVRRYSM